MNDTYIVITGRFQPLHLGHIDLWKCAIIKFKLPLIICILKKHNLKYNIDLNNTTEFDNLCLSTAEIDKNPLPDNIRKELLEIAISSDNLLQDNVELRFRDHPILD